MTDFNKDPRRDFRDSLGDSIHREVHDRIEEKMRRRAARRQNEGPQGVVFGAIVCVVGILLLLDHLGYINVDHLWRFWPLIPMGIGAAHMTEPGSRLWGGIVLLVGSLFLIDSLGILHLHWEQLWPLAIIGAGAVMIWNSLQAQRRRRAAGSPSSIPDTDSTMNAHAVFGGVERRITMQDFRFGRVSAVFGGVVLDFHDAGIDGDKAEIEVNAVFGGVEIRIPDTWRVEARNQTLFGGYEDSSRTSIRNTDAGVASTKLLILSGSTLFGGIEVKN